MRQYFIISLLAIMVGCNTQSQDDLVITIKNEPFSIVIPAKGELIAANATIINAPLSKNGMQNIAWMAPEFSKVSKGDVIVRFDGEAMTHEKEEKLTKLALAEQDVMKTNGELKQKLTDINKDLSLVDIEKIFAEQFSINDVRIRSKLEILDQMQNTEYLVSKQTYLNWKNDSFTESSKGELGLLTLKKKQHQDKITQLNSSLKQLEVYAPHDGLLTFETNWRGEKPRPGKTVWPGQKIAKLPDVEQMKLKLYVFEDEALGIETEQLITFSLNSRPNQQFKAKVETVSPYGNSIERGDPQKYIEVIATLEEQHTELFLPSLKVTASINVTNKQTRLQLPRQSVFSENNKSFVYLYQDGTFSKQQIVLGDSNLSHVVIESGLSEFQQVSLVKRDLL